jgi:hypothetical protein
MAAMENKQPTSTGSKSRRCFIAAFENRAIDAQLDEMGFSHGVLLFAIPDLGVLFRCRASGEMIDLEFGAMFALLKFIKDKLKSVGIKEVEILSSNPEFVFSFTGKSRHLDPKSKRMKMLREYSASFKLQVGFIEPHKNKALVRAIDYPSLPKGQTIPILPDRGAGQKIVFKPFQRGLSL